MNAQKIGIKKVLKQKKLCKETNNKLHYKKSVKLNGKKYGMIVWGGCWFVHQLIPEIYCISFYVILFGNFRCPPKVDFSFYVIFYVAVSCSATRYA